ncbi:MAG TPA: NUDIX hydrolase [Ruminococcaceae bacterium]|nr:NUDIX hydrolase [Oscillospiraceae bacterium]
MDMTFKTSEGVFNYRVDALILNGTKILMAHDKRFEQYYTIGGRVHFGETSEQAMLREVFEETGVRAEIDRLAFIHEGFFAIDGTAYQELALCYLIKPFDYSTIDFSAIKCDGENQEILWIDLADKEWCGDREIFPLWLTEKALSIPNEINHIVTVEEGYKELLK